MTGPIRAVVVVPAGGSGERMGGVAKPFLELAGRPILHHALEPFLAEPRVHQVVVALRPADAAEPPQWLAELDPRLRIVAGGATRGDSVRLALAAVTDDADVVLIHDAVRPLVSARMVARAIDAAAEGRGVVVAVPVTDTIHEVAGDGAIVGTPDRTRLWQAQTPQAFPLEWVREAYRRAARDGFAATDDATVVARCGYPVRVLEGERDNIKITTPLDLALAEVLLRERG